MDDNLLFILILIVFGTFIWYFFLRREAVIHSVINKTPSRQMSEINDGEDVRIRGKVVYLGNTMLAPLSKRKCAYYHVTVKDASNNDEVFRNYIDLNEEHGKDVIIFDGETYAIINTNLVMSNVTKDETFYSGFWNISSPELKAFLKKHGARETDYMGWSQDLLAKEGVLEEGEVLTVAGKATWRNSREFKFKIPASKVLYINPLDEKGVYLSDDPHV